MLPMANFDCLKMHYKCKAECCSDLTPIPHKTFGDNKSKIINEPKEIIDDSSHYVIETESHKCVFLNKDYTCNIYENRPPICQKFGDESHPFLICSWMSKCGKERSRQEKRRLERENDKYLNRFNKRIQMIQNNKDNNII